MTALKKYLRLESPGLWRDQPDAQRRDVIVSFGDASLVLTDKRGVALAHWSLPAIERLNPRQRPALFAPGPEADETVEIADDEMIEAIETVRKAIEKRRPHQGRLRGLLVGGTLAVLALLCVFWLPGALIGHAARVAPPETRADIGAQLAARITRVSGQACAGRDGRAALGKLLAALPADPFDQVVILPAGVATAAHLPGGVILLNRALVEDHEAPDVAAGFILAERLRAAQADPLRQLLDFTGLRSAFGLLTRGTLPPAALDAYAEHLMTTPPEPLPAEPLLTQFSAAGVPSTPYAYALDLSGESVLDLIEADPMRGRDQTQLLSDGDWVRLQNICAQ